MRIDRGMQRLDCDQEESVLRRKEQIGRGLRAGSAKVRTRNKGMLWGPNLSSRDKEGLKEVKAADKIGEEDD